MKNIVNQNEEEVMKNQKIKNAMLVCISNCLKKLNTEKIEIRKNETIEGIEYLIITLTVLEFSNLNTSILSNLTEGN